MMLIIIIMIIIILNWVLISNRQWSDVAASSNSSGSDASVMLYYTHTLNNARFLTWKHVFQVVVKPSGEMWMSCMGVTFHSRNDVSSITSAAKRLLAELQPGDAILVEEFCETFRPRHEHGQERGQDHRLVASTNGSSSLEDTSNAMTSPSVTSQLSFSATDVNSCRFRATVSRGPDNKAHMSKVWAFFLLFLGVSRYDAITCSVVVLSAVHHGNNDFYSVRMESTSRVSNRMCASSVIETFVHSNESTQYLRMELLLYETTMWWCRCWKALG